MLMVRLKVKEVRFTFEGFHGYRDVVFLFVCPNVLEKTLHNIAKRSCSVYIDIHNNIIKLVVIQRLLL